jgi:hypothetical protein
MKEELIRLLQYRTAEGATGPSALRNQGNSGVLAAARHFLKAINLFKFSVTTERRFNSVLDAYTNDLKVSFPKGARHWGTARKALNLYLRDVLYNRYLTRHFCFPKIEKWLEVPLDSYAAKAIRKGFGIKELPPWKGVKYLTPETSQAYQEAAKRLASKGGFARVHLDILYWRGVGKDSKLVNPSLHRTRKKTARRCP